MNSILHDNEIPIQTSLVRKLVSAQFPHYADLPLSRLSESGSSNVLFRLGDDLLVRLPRQPGGGSDIAKEQRWIPEVTRHLQVAVPEIVAIGEPAYSYTERWSIVRWLDGEIPNVYEPGESPVIQRSKIAADLADAILALRSIAVSKAAATDPSLRWYRGSCLKDFDAQFRIYIAQCRLIKDMDLDLDDALAVWQSALTVPGAAAAAPDCWYHGDLVAENLLVVDGRLSSILDFGGLAIGDPTIDLHGAWELFDAPAREVFRTQLKATEAEWLLGRAWALATSLGCLHYYWDTMPRRRRHRLAMVKSVLLDAAE